MQKFWKPINRDTLDAFDTAKVLEEMYYGKKPNEREAFVNELIRLARSGNIRIRRALTIPKLLQKDASPLTGGNKKTIANIADIYCMIIWNVRVFEAVKHRAPLGKRNYDAILMKMIDTPGLRFPSPKMINNDNIVPASPKADHLIEWYRKRGINLLGNEQERLAA